MSLRSILRRTFIAAVGTLLTVSPVLAATALEGPSAAEDRVLGSPGARVTVIEYASLGCPHCAWWAIEVFPRFKARYIDTGKVRLVFREVLFGDPALAAAGFLTARCAAPSEYFQVVDDVFREQDYLLHDGLIVLEQIAQRAGVDHARFQACLQDKAALASLQARSDGYVARDKVTGTPTFIIGEQRLEGAQTLDTLDAAILAAERQATTRRGGP